MFRGPLDAYICAEVPLNHQIKRQEYELIYLIHAKLLPA